MGGVGVRRGDGRWVGCVYASARTQRVPGAKGLDARGDGETTCTRRGRKLRPTATKCLDGCMEPMRTPGVRVVVGCGAWWTPACEKAALPHHKKGTLFATPGDLGRAHNHERKRVAINQHITPDTSAPSAAGWQLPTAPPRGFEDVGVEGVKAVFLCDKGSTRPPATLTTPRSDRDDVDTHRCEEITRGKDETNSGGATHRSCASWGDGQMVVFRHKNTKSAKVHIFLNILLVTTTPRE